jgi:glutamine amidotransferase-like uncharacterized protein
MVINKNNNISKKIIRVAVLAEEPLGWGSGKHYFPMILDKYSWKKNNIEYEFKTEYITDKNIIKGTLKVENFDVLLVPGGGVGDGECIAKGFNCLPRVRKWKKNISNFIKNGGGYIGICGGAALLTSFKFKSDGYQSFFERQYDKSAVGVSCIKSYYKEIAFPLFYPFQKKHPEKIGPIGYIFSFAPGQTSDDVNIHTGGVPIDFKINKNNPIFSDVQNNEIKIRWWGGPGLLVPENPDRNVKAIAWYPKKDVSEDEKTSVYAWRYTGNFIGLLKGMWKAFKLIKKNNDSLKNLLLYAYYLSGPWQKSEKKIIMDMANKASITTEIYPNENKGRILLCTSHPEYMIWYNGSIKEINGKVDGIGYGFHKWNEINKLSKDLIDEFTHTWWIVRRLSAWAAKIPDDQLPPIEKGIINNKAKKILSENVFWDGTLKNQMFNI